MSWQKLNEVYGQRGIILALGAGVSKGSGLPNWRGILHRLVTDHIGQGDDTLFDKLALYGLSLPAIASLLEEHSANRKEFVERVRAALYGDFAFYPEGVDKSNRRQFVADIKASNPTLRAVASLCAAAIPDKNTFTINSHIQAIVNFNLDALLQAYVYARYEKRLLRTIERPSASTRPQKINIYQMHGYLRFDQQVGDQKREAPDAVVFTEQDYFDFFNDPTSLFNYTFLYLLREYACLFIGLSMQDDNIRRLLHYSKKERIRSLEREGLSKSLARQKAQRHFAVLQRSGMNATDQAVADTLRPLGTTVLWVDEFDELSSKLADLYCASGDNWAKVY